jgi:cob(I)alamin adenosyltransferase
MALKIYTKTGDKGTTSLIGGTKVPKSHLRIESYGTVDELNSYIGLLNDQLAAGPSPSNTAPSPSNTALSPFNAAPSPSNTTISTPPPIPPVNQSFPAGSNLLREIQDRLFTIGASLACDPDKEPKLKIPDLKEADLTLLEKEMDRMEEELPPMKSFILPGGHVAVSTAHIARCICRRAERICVGMQEEGLFIEPIVLKYINRLSDYLFVLARYTAHQLNVPEIPWRPRV